jgi:hypothetical protein
MEGLIPIIADFHPLLRSWARTDPPYQSEKSDPDPPKSCEGFIQILIRVEFRIRIIVKRGIWIRVSMTPYPEKSFGSDRIRIRNTASNHSARSHTLIYQTVQRAHQPNLITQNIPQDFDGQTLSFLRTIYFREGFLLACQVTLNWCSCCRRPRRPLCRRMMRTCEAAPPPTLPSPPLPSYSPPQHLDVNCFIIYHQTLLPFLLFWTCV